MTELASKRDGRFDLGTEDELHVQRAKLYTFEDDVWTEKCLGEAKLLKDFVTKKTRFCMWDDKTDTPVANHYLLGYAPYCDLKQSAESPKCLCWIAQDFSEASQGSVVQFALQLRSEEAAAEFSEYFNMAKEANSEVEEWASLFEELNGALGKAGEEAEALGDGTLSDEVVENVRSHMLTIESPVDEENFEKLAGSYEQFPASLAKVNCILQDFLHTGLANEPLLFRTFGEKFVRLCRARACLEHIASSAAKAETDPYMEFQLQATSTLELVAEVENMLKDLGYDDDLAASQAFENVAFAEGFAEGKAGQSDPEAAITEVGGAVNSEGKIYEDPVKEADEEELYAQLSKIYRFVNEKWDEGYKGQATLRKHKETGKVRFFMKDDKTQQVVGDHLVVIGENEQYCDLKPNNGSDKCWVWSAQDNSDGQKKVTTLALKFGSEEKAAAFKQLFDKAKETNKKAVTAAPTKEAALSKPAESQPTAPSPSKPSSGKTENGVTSPVKAPEGTGSSLFATSPSSSGSSSLFASTGSSLFASASTSTSLFAEASSGTAATSGGSSLFSSSSGNSLFPTTPATGSSLFSAASSSSSLFPAGPPSTGSSLFPTGPSSGSSLFASAPSSGSSLFPTSASSGSSLFSPSPSSGSSLFASAPASGSSLFASAPSSGSSLFPTGSSSGSSLFAPASTLFPTASSSGTTSNTGVVAPVEKAENAEGGEEELVAEEEVTVIPGWEASVSLDVLDEVPTGVEDEEEIYSQRSKLRRFRDGDWKERGLGEAKLLKHKVTGKIRFLMRQEKTEKIVGNFWVMTPPDTPYCNLVPLCGDTKIWVWTCIDCSEDEPQAEQLCLRFKTEEIAAEFKEKFEEAKKTNMELESGQAPTNQTTEAPKSSPSAPKESSKETPASTFIGTPPVGPSTSPKKTAEPEVKPLFGGSDSANGSSLFGGTGSSLFGGTGSSLFGGSSMSNPFGGGLKLLGSDTSSTLFGGSSGSSGGGLFGAMATPSTTTPAPTGNEAADDDEYVQDEEVTTIPGWAPSVTLEVNDVVETGEEDEEELYCQRSKLFRFRDGDWKERGLGDAKLLKNKQNGRVRFLLRQEKTNKIVANHYVHPKDPYCNLKPNPGSEKCWQWIAMDNADESPEKETFLLKFGQVELAATFKTEFEKARTLNGQLQEFVEDAVASPSTKPQADPTPAVSEAKPASFFSAASNSPASSPQGSTSGSLFSAPAASSSSSSLFSSSNGVSSGSSLFGATSSLSSPPNGGGLFSSLATNTSGTGSLFSSTASSGGGLFQFSQTTGSLFSSTASTGGGMFSSLVSSTTTPAPTSAPADTTAEQQDDEYVVEEEVTEVPGWQASVTLEVKDTVEMGEEHEDELYSQRSKLFRFRDGDWKERGLGEAKLLKHKDTGKVRFMLRQEKTGKIVANHYVFHHGTYCDLKPQGGNPKIWMWLANDFAEEEPADEKLALKFGSEELAEAFKVEFEKAKDLNKAVLDISGGDSKPAPKAVASPVLSPKKDVTPPPPPPPPPAAENSNPFAGMSMKMGGSTGSSGGLFSQTAPTGGLFSTLAAATSGSGLFGGGSGSGLFSGTASSNGSGLFGASSSGSGLFGASSSASSGSGLFSNSQSTGGSGLFASAASSGGSAGVAAPSTEGQNEEHEDLLHEEEVTHIEGWAPSVTLEVQAHVETGEEHESVVYCQRSKLLRFKDGEWKERGIGEAKILKHKTKSQCRFLFRQEKTNYLRANFYIVEDPKLYKLSPNQGNMKIWTWMAQDYADEEVQVEQFALKFKDEEQAAEFKKAFDEAKIKPGASAKAASAPSGNATPQQAEGAKFWSEFLADQSPKADKQEDDEGDDEDYDDDDEEEVEVVAAPKQAPATTGAPPANCLAALAAQQAAGKWKCGTCGLMWGDEAIICNACETPRPGYEDQAKASGDKGKQDAMAAFLGKPAAQGGFSFASTTPSSGGFSFTPSASSSSTGFGFGQSGQGIVVPPPTASTSTILFGNTTGGGLFGNNTGGGFGNNTGGGLFGANPSSGTGSLFGTASTGGSLFATPSSSSSSSQTSGGSSGGSLFGKPFGGDGLFAASTSGSLFSTASSSSSSALTSSVSTGGGLFGAPLSSSSSALTASTGGGLFGAPSSGSSSPGLFAMSTGGTLTPPKMQLNSAAPSDGLASKALSPVVTMPPAAVQAPPPMNQTLLPPSTLLNPLQVPPPPPMATLPPSPGRATVGASPTTVEEQRLLAQMREEMNHFARSTQALHAKEVARLEAELREQAKINERTEARAVKAEEQLRAVSERIEDKVRSVEDRVANTQDTLRTEVHKVREKVSADIVQLREEGTELKIEQGKCRSDIQAQQQQLRSTVETATEALQVAQDCQKASQRLEDIVSERVLALQHKVSGQDRQALRGKSIADQIMYYQRSPAPALFGTQ